MYSISKSIIHAALLTKHWYDPDSVLVMKETHSYSKKNTPFWSTTRRGESVVFSLLLFIMKTLSHVPLFVRCRSNKNSVTVTSKLRWKSKQIPSETPVGTNISCCISTTEYFLHILFYIQFYLFLGVIFAKCFYNRTANLNIWLWVGTFSRC